jgi:type IV secretion system protein VirB3
MQQRNAGLIADPLFIGATRPSMLWGVTYSAVMLNAMCILELFLLTKNLLILLLAAPIHGVCMLLCARDARYFDLVLLWGRTRLPAFLANLRFWKASSYSPLNMDLPDARGYRRGDVATMRIISTRDSGPVDLASKRPPAIGVSEMVRS